MSDTYSPEKRGPGRPSNAEKAARDQVFQATGALGEIKSGDPVVSVMDGLTPDAPGHSFRLTRAEETQRTRRRRQDTGPLEGLKLHVPEELKEEGYVYHWFNDKDGGGRIHNKTVLDDWDIVRTKAIDGQGEGTPVTRIVGKTDGGQAMKAYLCKKPKEYYDADKAKSQARIKAKEDEIKSGFTQNPKGLSSAELSRSPNYVPEGGISIHRDT